MLHVLQFFMSDTVHASGAHRFGILGVLIHPTDCSETFHCLWSSTYRLYIQMMVLGGNKVILSSHCYRLQYRATVSMDWVPWRSLYFDLKVRRFVGGRKRKWLRRHWAYCVRKSLQASTMAAHAYCRSYTIMKRKTKWAQNDNTVVKTKVCCVFHWPHCFAVKEEEICNGPI